MKKTITTLCTVAVALLCSFSASAQWHDRFYPADELRETEEHTLFFYQGENGHAFYVSNGNFFFVTTESGIFDYEDGYIYGCIIGFYENGELISKEKATMEVNDTKNTAIIYKESLAREIISHINKNGDVRFIIPRYNRSDFDMTVPIRKNVTVL